jgi:hypothetical protein
LRPSAALLDAYFYRVDYDMTIGYVDGNYEMETVADSLSTFGLASDGKVIFYLQNGVIYKVNAAEQKTEQIGGSNTSAFCPAPDGKSVYYFDEFNGGLWYDDGTETHGVPIFDLYQDTGGNSLFAYSLMNNAVYTITDNQLIVLKNGVVDKRVNVNVFDDIRFSDFSYVYLYANDCMVAVSCLDYADHIYRYITFDGEKFVNIEEY